MSIESRCRQYGKVFDHWQIKEFLGSGSGGKTAVFRLVRTDSGWGVSALKIVNLIEERGDYSALTDYQRQDYITAREECSRNAEQEVRLMDELRGNTNIVDYLDHTFVDWSDENGFGRDLLIRMEFLSVLRNDLKSGKAFTEAEILKVGRDICKALVLCHKKNILHRDIKPENIFRNKDGSYKLGDFGVSRVLDACPGAVASTGIGTFEYWPAEQMTGQYDKRVDIYSLGLVMYELSNRNRLPFAASTYVTNREVSKRLSGSPLPRPDYASSALGEVILKACSFNPAERYQSAAEFLKAINTVQQKTINMPQTKSPEPAPTGYAVNNEDDYATALAKELGLPEDIFKDDTYRTIPASANKAEVNVSSATEASYATKPAEKKQINYQLPEITASPKRRLKRFPIVISSLAILFTLGFGIGIVFARIAGKTSSKSAELLTNEEIFIGSVEEVSSDIDSLQIEDTVTEKLPPPESTFEFLESTEIDSTAEPFLLEIPFHATAEAGRAHTVGLKADGTVVAVGENDYGQCNVSDWRDIVSISAGGFHTVGLKADGTAVAVGLNLGGRCNVNDWRNIIAISATGVNTVGLKADGTAIALGYNGDGRCNVSEWRDIVAISSSTHTVGLKADGTVVAIGSNDYGQCNVSDWRDIVSISAGGLHTVGLKADGTVVAVGENGYGQCNVSDWRDIVSISAGDLHTVGLKADGSVVSVGENDYGQCNVSDWRDIVSISAGGLHTVGLKADGTVVAVGRNEFGQCNVNNWKNIGLPAAAKK